MAFPSETLADGVDGLVCARSRLPFLCSRTPSFVGKPERQLQLEDGMSLEIEPEIASSEMVFSSR